MQHIDLKPEYVDLIRKKKKTSTVRAGRRNTQLGAATIGMNGEYVHVLITKVSYTFFGLLKHVDAVKDGFGSKAELISVLKDIYPRLHDRHDVTIIEFDYVENENE